MSPPKQYTNSGVEFTYIEYESRGVQIGDGVNPAISQSINSKIIIPETIDSQQVISIGAHAFENCQFTGIELPNTIEIIGNYAFNYSKILSFTAPPSLKIIEDSAFQKSRLITADLSQCTVKSFIGINIFSSSMLLDVKFPESLEIINEWCFSQTKLQNVTITKNIKQIKQAAFIDCQDLTLFISESPYFEVLNGIVYSPDFKTLYCYPSKCTLEILPTVRYIDSCRAFSACSLTSFVLKSPVKSIGSFIFRKSNEIEFIDLTCGIFTYIGYASFGWCPKLTEVRLPNTVTHMGQRICLYSNLLKTLIVPSELISGATAFNESSLTDIYYCGTGPVTGSISLDNLRIHVTNNYRGSQFMKKGITDRTASCEMQKCPRKYLDLFVCTIPLHGYYEINFLFCIFCFVVIEK